MGRITARIKVEHIDVDRERVRRVDTVAVEEPLEIRLGDEALSVTMRTPGADIELAQGFLLTEGIISARSDVVSIRYCEGAGPDGLNTYNVLRVDLAAHNRIPDRRNFLSNSSCGVCGKASLDEVALRSPFDVHDDGLVVAPSTLVGLPSTLRSAQQVFDQTGGIHGAALFDADGQLLVSREDVGRHNAVDKVIGWALENNRIPLRDTIMMVSSRLSFEITQKALMAGVPLVAAVSAPSSLAIELANENGLTLVGFLRGTSMNVYTNPHRVQ